MTYWYCGIKVKGIDKVYSYISDIGQLEVGAYVEVPFGYSNDIKIGIVENCGEYSESEAPYPVENTKHIIRISSEDEYEEQEKYDDYWQYSEELDDVQFLIYIEEWNEVLEWALKYHTVRNRAVRAKVIECYKLCMKMNIPLAAYKLSEFYYSGDGVKQNCDEAFHLCKLAADSGEISAVRELGYRYCCGRGCETDLEKAVFYFSEGAILFEDTECIFKLGDLYLSGNYAQQNSQYAFMLYKRALETVKEPDNENIAYIQYRLGKCLLYGVGTSENCDLAEKYLHMALVNFYRRSKYDPFVRFFIRCTKDLICETEKRLDELYDCKA